MNRWRRACGVGLLAVAATGCGAPYLLRAAYEEARILLRREPITDVLARESVDAPLRDKLRFVLAARQFAGDWLGFAVGESYATYARVDTDAVAYVVTAAYRDRLEAYTWRYPILGRLPYRGFFDRGRADVYAAQLEARDLDTAVWPTTAFSTLGWFADPVLSSMLAEDTVELVTTVFHELTHAFLYVPSAAAFNESFANFVGHRAAIVFFCDEALQRAVGAGAPASRCRLAEERWHDERVYAAVIEEVADALTTLYAAPTPAATRAETRRHILAAATATLAQRPLQTERYRDRDLARYNNAVLLQQLLYRRALEQFEAVRHGADGDLRRTIIAIAAAVKESPDPFADLGRLARGEPRVSAAPDAVRRPGRRPRARRRR